MAVGMTRSRRNSTIDTCRHDADEPHGDEVHNEAARGNGGDRDGAGDGGSDQSSMWL